MAKPDEEPRLTGLDAVKAAIRLLPREDRAMLRPWLLACFDVRGYEERRVEPPRASSE
jgi:hypothetical protein